MKREKQMSKKWIITHLMLAMFLAMSLVLGNLSISSMEASAEGDVTLETIDISDYDYLVFKDDGVYSAVYYDAGGSNIYGESKVASVGDYITLTGTNTSILIAVESGTHNITFSDVSATNNESAYGALYIAGGTVNVTVADGTTNTFNGYYSDIIVSNDAILNIDGGEENTGVLTVGDSDNWNTSSGIGSYYNGVDSNLADCGTITISGATVNAYGYSGGAAIGGSGATITIDGNAVVNATSSGAGAAIGTSQNGGAANITIIDTANVTAKNIATSSYATAIGGGDSSVTGTINISGDSTVYASSTVGTAIGGGGNALTSNTNGSSGNITISDNATVTAIGGTNTSFYGAGIGSGRLYRGTDGTIIISDNAIVTATGGEGSAGIGTSTLSNIQSINITGGTIIATGGTDIWGSGYSGAGIGAGYYSSVSEINISGGQVTAYGELYGAAIGGGCESYGGEISISGSASVVAVPYNNSYSTVIGDGYINTGYYSAGTSSTIYIEKTDNFIAYSTSAFGDCTFTNTGDVEFIQIMYVTTQLVEGAKTEVKDSEGNVVASFTADEKYVGVILGIDSEDVDDTYTVYYNGETQMHKESLSEGQFSDEFTVTNGYSYYINVEDAEYAYIYDDYFSLELDMDYNEADQKIVVYAGVNDSTYYVNSYQWQIKNDEDVFEDIDGATSNTYIIPQTTEVGVYEYQLVITTKYKYNNSIPMTQVTSATITVTVEQAENVISDLTLDDWVYGSDENTPTATATYTDDTHPIVYTYSTSKDGNYTSEVPTDAGTYYVKASVAESTNYESGEAIIDFTISEADVSVVIDDQEIVRGMSIPTFTSTVSGVVNDDVITVAYSIITDNMTAGDYTITMINTSDYPNYDITVTTGTLTITDGYTVSFDDTDVTDIAYGTTVSQPADPTKDGYIFIGWYLGNSEFDFTTAITGDLELTSVWEAVVEKEIETTGSAEVTIEADVEEQLLDELFTEEEIALNVEMKVTVQVDIVEVTDMEESAQEQFTAYLEEYQTNLDENETVIQAVVFDISVIKSLAGVDENITALATPIRITIEIPEEYQAEGSEFFILRNHDGEITILEDLDDDPTTITIETDRFSNYTLNYVETDGADVDDEADIDDDIDATATVPDTGDHSSPQMLMIVMFASLLGILVISKKKLVK